MKNRSRLIDRHRLAVLGAMLCSSAFLPAATAHAQTGQGVATDGDPAELDTIVVTAQKREQNLQDVPVAVSAFNAEAIAANRIQNVLDLNAVAPNLTVRTLSGGLGGPSYSMRGIVTYGSAPGSDRGIASYVDNVYIGPALGSIMDIADIERIEVLRGPQGTLFGRSATGGAINVITRNPVGKFGLRQDVTVGNYRQLRSKTRIDTPSFGPLSASATYLHSERRGDIRNLGAGTTWDFTASSGGRAPIRKSPKWLGNQNVEAVNAAVKLDLGQLKAVYKFDWSENEFTPSGMAPVYFNPAGLGALGNLVNAMIAKSPTPGQLTAVTKTRPDAVNNWFTTEGLMRNQGHSLTTTYDFGVGIQLRNILAYRKSYVNSTSQIDGMGGLINNITPNIGALGAPYILLGTNSTQRAHQWSDEVQLNVNTDWFALTAGYLHYRDQTSLLSDGINFLALPNFTFPKRNTLPSVINLRSQAVFVQNELHLTDKLDAVLGARLTWDRKWGVDNTIAGKSTPFALKGSQPTFLAGLNYKPADDVLLYAKYSTGYISGGYLATLAYQAETAKSWEGGIKADWLDRRLRTNLAVFHAKYRNLQFVTSGLNVGVPAARQVVVNGGDAHAWGIEFEGMARPVSGLSLSTGIGYTDFRYDRTNPVLQIARASFRPKWAGNFAAEYETPIGIGEAKLALRADATYRSKTYTSQLPLTSAFLDAVTVGSVWLLNGRLALRNAEIGGVKTQVALWGRNLTNDRSQSSGASIAFIQPSDFERARTFGIDFSFEL